MDWRVSLIVGLVVGWFAHTLAVSRDRRSARRSAAKDFQASVLDALSGLYPLPTSWPDNVDASLRQLFPALQRAVAAFRPYLPAWRRWAFDRAWNEHRCGTGRDIDLQNYHHYIGFQSNPNAKENFRRNIDRLLAFSNKLAV
jgi:hypothetical protein